MRTFELSSQRTPQNRHVKRIIYLLRCGQIDLLNLLCAKMFAKLQVKPDHGWKIDSPKVCLVSDLQNIRLHETRPQCSRGSRVKRRNNNAIWQLSLTQYS